MCFNHFLNIINSTLVSKIDYEKEGGNLAVELRKGAELIATATLAIFSAETGCGPSVKRYTKQYARGVVASLIALITSFHDGSALVGGKENQLGPQKTGAVWSACDAIQQLPKGNRNAMRRECMVWIRDCMESIAEFEEVMALGEREDGDEEEMYTAEEMKIVKASVNVMKCTKNVLGLVLKACDCVGDYLENSKIDEPAIDATTTQDQKSEILQWIHQLHELARAIGEGVTDLGILLYPPLDLGNNASKSSLANQVNDQLQSLEGCVTSINEASTPISNMSMKSCMSDEVVEAVEKLINGVNTRSHEVQSAW
jgi:methyl-accepting chemotaxis protein